MARRAEGFYQGKIEDELDDELLLLLLLLLLAAGDGVPAPTMVTVMLAGAIPSSIAFTVYDPGAV